jgi:methionyl-tRNA synthetase
MITIDDFASIELRTARIQHAERVEGTDKLMRLVVEIDGEERQLVAGIAKSYSAAELPGKKIVVVANLQPATIRGVESNGMVLAAADKDGNPTLVTFDRFVATGCRVR